MKKINGKQWKDALLSGVNAMANNRVRIDALNVFPVPDGDTGSNMGATAQYAGNEISRMRTTSIADVSAKFARGMLLGARGNSGVIISQIFKGFAVSFEGKEEVSGFDLTQAFDSARDYAYKSVMKPIEGTILTVIRMTAENLSKTVTPSHSIEDVMKLAVKFAREATDKTPEMLPVLKEVGVTDSGGEGLFLILEGMKLAIEGVPVKLLKEEIPAEKSVFEGVEDWDGEFGYCTEFVVELKAQKAFKKDRFEAALLKMGTSVVVVHDEDILKVHIHTLRPGNVFSFAQRFGEFITLKSENMTIQANESHQSKSEPSSTPSVSKGAPVSNQKVNVGVIACNIGQGIINDMKELGADFIIEGGQSMNPSASDFIKAIDQINSEQIIILPNNSNIILVAQQVAQTVKDKQIIIVPAKTQMQGLAAMINFNREGTLKDNQEQMTEGIESVKTGQVTKASRTTKIKGVSVKEGEFLAIAEKKILKSSPSKIIAAEAISKELIDEDTEIVTIYYGNEATEVDASEFASYLETHFDVEVEIKNGDQPVYDFLIAFE